MLIYEINEFESNLRMGTNLGMWCLYCYVTRSRNRSSNVCIIKGVAI